MKRRDEVLVGTFLLFAGDALLGTLWLVQAGCRRAIRFTPSSRGARTSSRTAGASGATSATCATWLRNDGFSTWCFASTTT